MKLSAIAFYPIVAVLFLLDSIFYYGNDEGTEFVIKYSPLFLGISLVGFIALIFVNKENIGNKYLPGVMIVVGIILNLVLAVTWYIFKDFGF